MAYSAHAGSKKTETGFFGINAQINVYLAKQLSGTSINSRRAAGQYDARAAGKVGSLRAETGKSGQCAPKPTF